MTDLPPHPAARPSAAISPRQIVDWLVSDAPRLEMGAFVDGLGWRMRGAGVPLDRLANPF